MTSIEIHRQHIPRFRHSATSSNSFLLDGVSEEIAARIAAIVVHSGTSDDAFNLASVSCIQRTHVLRALNYKLPVPTFGTSLYEWAYLLVDGIREIDISEPMSSELLELPNEIRTLNLTHVSKATFRDTQSFANHIHDMPNVRSLHLICNHSRLSQCNVRF